MVQHSIQLRPNVSNGLWLGFILPTAIVFSVIKHNVESSETYRHCCYISLGIMYTTIAFIWKYVRRKDVSLTDVDFKDFVLPIVSVSVMIYTQLNSNLVFCCFSGLLSTLGFYKIYMSILKNFPLCFTFGEALFCAQGVTFFIYSSIINLFGAVYVPPRTSLQIATLIIELGLLSVFLICLIASKFKYFQRARNFYALTASISVFILLLPLHILLRQSSLIWMYNLFTKDISTIVMFLYWSICSSLAAFAINRQIKGAKKASTAIRKIFHILAVLVFLPGLLYECSIIYLASGVTLGIFFALELLRNLNIPPLSSALQDGFMVFRDEKDVGSVALTPMYLLGGCALPLWVHPAPCDLTDSAGFNLLPLISGLLSVGIGDTLASYVGVSIGRHKWTGSNKTIEGTLVCILGQFLTIYLLFTFGFISVDQQNIAKILIGVIVVSVVEAKTTQIDNLALPLLMYLIFL